MTPAAETEQVLAARSIAIRTAEARRLEHRLLQAARDPTPGVRRLLTPTLYQIWMRDRARGWTLLERLSVEAVRFPGIPNGQAAKALGEVSMPILSATRGDAEAREKLLALWRGKMRQLFESPLVRIGRLLARRFVLNRAAAVLVEMMRSQPAYQLVNYGELAATFGRPLAARGIWRQALACLEDAAAGTAPLLQILRDDALAFDVYLMLVCERGLIAQGAGMPAEAFLEVLEQLFRQGRPWFRQSLLYAGFHVLYRHDRLDAAVVQRFLALTREYYEADAWLLQTTSGRYVSLNQLANADVIAARHGMPGQIAGFVRHALASGEPERIRGIFDAIDGLVFYHQAPELALAALEVAFREGRDAVEERVLASLATVRVLHQALVDEYLEARQAFVALPPALVAAAVPSMGEDDLLTLIDRFVVSMMLDSPAFRGQMVAAFRRALLATTVQEFCAQLFEWARDEVANAYR